MKQQHMGRNGQDPNASMDIVQPKWAPAWLRAATAFVVGVLMIQTGLDVLGVRLELFSGLSSFNAAWVTALTVLPVATGIVIGVIYGYGGKYLAHFPPVVVLLISYNQTMHTQLPEGVHMLPWGLWVIFLILQAEFCAVGGFIGELLIRRRSSWTSHQYARKSDSERLPDERDS